MLTVRGQQHSFSTHERVFLGKCQSFWDRKCIELRGLKPPTFGLMPNALTYWAIRAAHLRSHVVEYWLWRYRYLWSKVNIWNIDCALATAFIFDTQALIWNLKVRFMGVVIGQGNTVSQASDSLLFLLCINLTNNSWYTTIWNLTLKKSMSRSWVSSRLYSSPGTQPMHFLFVMRKLDKLFVRSG